ncbi:FAD-binding oxidoreductase [Variovorax sp. M-6]
MPSSLLCALIDALGTDGVYTGDAIAPRHHTDWSGTEPRRPLALLRPSHTAQVAQALRLCHVHGVPVVPQGGMTGLAGGAVPTFGAVALSLERMNAIESLDATAGTLVCQAGATLQAVQEAAKAAGCVFGVDLGARGSCQIGGNLATNAGGNGVVQFGMMREQALGLEVVLADGTVLDMMRPMLKNNTGYDLKHWFIGSEGTLGVITRALLQLHPEPRARATVLAALADYASAMTLLTRLKACFPGTLAAFELMWEDFQRFAFDATGTPSPFTQSHPFTVLAEVSGSDNETVQDALQHVLEVAMEDGLVLDAALAQSEAQAAALWRIREATAEIPSRMQSINFDISLPLQAMGDFAERCVQRLSERWPSQRSVRFGHLGDGNLHLSTDARSLGGLPFKEAEREVEALVYGLVAQANGSVSAEHGIGLHKKPYLGVSRSPAELAAMRAIKHALDPLDLLNPGKVFDPA